MSVESRTVSVLRFGATLVVAVVATVVAACSDANGDAEPDGQDVVAAEGASVLMSPGASSDERFEALVSLIDCDDEVQVLGGEGTGQCFVDLGDSQRMHVQFGLIADDARWYEEYGGSPLDFAGWISRNCDDSSVEEQVNLVVSPDYRWNVESGPVGDVEAMPAAWLSRFPAGVRTFWCQW
jgi:hypothetical protein